MTKFLTFMTNYKSIVETLVATINLIIFLWSFYKFLTKNKTPQEKQSPTYNNSSHYDQSTNINHSTNTSISQVNNYEIPTTNKSPSNENDNIMPLLIALACLIFYSFLAKYYFYIAIILSLFLSLRYLLIKYWNFTQFIIPTSISSISYLITYYPPNNFWNKLVYPPIKIYGMSDLVTLIFDRATIIVKEIFNNRTDYFQLISSISMAIFAIFSLYLLFREIVQRKNKIRRNDWKDFFVCLFIFILFTSFIYIQNDSNPIKFIIERFINFVQN